jgi:hypothetical protein
MACQLIMMLTRKSFGLRNLREQSILTLYILEATRTTTRWKDSMENLDREKVMRDSKTKDTPILTGYQIFHNYIRPHEGLDGKTTGEACRIRVEGKNKWVTLIQNASEKRKPKSD